MDVQLHCVIKKILQLKRKKLFFYTSIFDSVLAPYLRETDVTIVTEYAFCVWYNSCVFIRHLKKNKYQFGTNTEKYLCQTLISM